MVSGKTASVGSLGGRTILLVEDEALIGLEIEMTLKRAGAVVIGPVGRLPQVISTIEEERFDAAILDIALYKEEVFPAADMLVRSGVPFIFHTGHGERTELAETYPSIPVAQKPTSPTTLVTMMVKVLG